MTQSPVTVTYPLEEVLGRIERKIDERFDEVSQKLEGLQKDVTDLKIGQAELKGDIKALENKVDAIDSRLEKVENEQGTLVKDISDLKGAKSLIIPIIVAVTTSLVTLLIRSLPNP